MAFFWVSLYLLGGYLYSELLRKFSNLSPGLVEDSTDIRIYREAGEAILAGDVPYRDFFIEYPPGSLPAFVPPALFTTSREAYATLFALEMTLVLVTTLVLTAYAARMLFGWWWPLSAAVFTVATLLLYPVAVTRYDAIVALALAATVALATAGIQVLGQTSIAGAAALTAAWAFLGFGAAAKLVPALATLPLALLVGQKEHTRTLRETTWSAARGFAVFFGVVVAFFLPAFLFGGEGLINSFSYHADRGLQLESLAASVLMKLGHIEGVSFEYGALEVQGWGVELLSFASLPVTATLVIITAVVMYREHRAGRLGPRQLPRFMAAFVLAFLLGSKVLSPQYMIWLLPLMPLSASGAWGIGVSGVFLAICWTTTQVFPYHYGEVGEGVASGVNILLGRNLLLVILWILMLSLPSSGRWARKPTPINDGRPAAKGAVG